MIWRLCIWQETIFHFRISGTNLRNTHQIRSTQVRIGWITREGHKWACLDKMQLTMLVTRTTNTSCKLAKLAKTKESDRKWFTSASETLLVLSSLGSHLGPGCGQKACNVQFSLLTLGHPWQVNLSHSAKAWTQPFLTQSVCRSRLRDHPKPKVAISRNSLWSAVLNFTKSCKDSHRLLAEVLRWRRSYQRTSFFITHEFRWHFFFSFALHCKCCLPWIKYHEFRKNH